MAATLPGSSALKGSLRRALAVAFALLGLLQPRAFVWCQAESGHAALEALDAGCCSAPDLEASCAPGSARAGSRGTDGGEAMETGACRDVLVEAPTSLPLDERSPLPEVALYTTATHTPAPPQLKPAPSGPGGSARTAAHELVLSTVLRV